MRRRLEEEPDNAERWLVSYADFITLLFAFFVVMYSISSVNEGKYKVLSQSLEGVFNGSPKTIEPIQVGEITQRSESESKSGSKAKPIFLIPESVAKEKIKEDLEKLQLESIAGEFEKSFEDLIYEDNISVKTEDDWIEVSLNDTVIFSSGGVEPIHEALAIIEKIARIMSSHNNAMLIEGHTDNVPISSSAYPSNWELSAARAASVVRYLALEGIAASRMGAMGYGEFQPVARNDTDEGRRKNRRVILLISKGKDIRESLLK
ncbi:MAG: chemotaxis protein MotB [Pseudohongiellaceae bacterium]|jgi:chemotaxis protein MotB